MSEKKPRPNGKAGSTLFARGLKKKVKLPSRKLLRMLAKVYNRYQQLDESEADARAREDFVFHMADWEDDLFRLAKLYRRPEQFDDKTAGQIVFGFLSHALHHLLPAGRLLLGEIHDIFAETDKKK